MNHFGTSQWLVIVSTRFESLQRRPLKFTAARKYVMVPGYVRDGSVWLCSSGTITTTCGNYNIVIFV